ncbi:type II toxin-antitoxin system MqsA family antitoxin [Pseudomonas protegens]|uniref:type II toxin-antitoxin system MqsA family antitoxin n=1 Tax=Pseudomonas protegens TaxID=380021 RepID=UPI002743808D|nr:type II toxin-antitoxin system MqsA family antitoxin [Pseudomonas protegens]MDP9526864.1 type II toxin-antitoxin system MqsA family antitoxin [Pseudomonas protegens]
MKRQQCYSCGAPTGMLAFEQRSELIDYRHLQRHLHGLGGWECQECGEIEFDAASAERYSAAGDQLLEEYRQSVAADIKRIRRKLHLSQKEAVKLLSGGGHNAFSRYERGEVGVPQPLYVLMRLLDRHPRLMKDVLELGESRPAPSTLGAPAEPQLGAAGG